MIGEKDINAFYRLSDPGAGARILDLGWEGQYVGAGWDEAAKSICFLSSDVRSIRLCKRVLEELERTNSEAFLGDSPGEVPGESFDLVRYRPAQRAAKEQVFEWIDASFACLKMGGRFFLAGRRDRGVESYVKYVRTVFGRAEKVGQSGRTRVYCAGKSTENPGCEPLDSRRIFEVEDLPGGPYRFETRAGVFSRDGLDPGTRFLLEYVSFQEDARILDLGCGYGAIGVVGARLASAGRATLVDADVRSTRCALKNIKLNKIQNAHVQVGDAFEGVGDAPFDLITSNPPFHEGNTTGHPFIEGAARRLVSTGQLWLVAMRPGPYRKRLQERFDRVETVGFRDGYTVLRAERPIKVKKT